MTPQGDSSRQLFIYNEVANTNRRERLNQTQQAHRQSRAIGAQTCAIPGLVGRQKGRCLLILSSARLRSQKSLHAARLQRSGYREAGNTCSSGMRSARREGVCMVFLLSLTCLVRLKCSRRPMRHADDCKKQRSCSVCEALSGNVPQELRQCNVCPDPSDLARESAKCVQSGRWQSPRNRAICSPDSCCQHATPYKATV